MEKRLEIQRFIEGNPDWESVLQGAPYFLKIQRDSVLGRNLVLFKYSQCDSSFDEPLVRECRGLILDADTFEPVCVPFFKFFNAGERHADEIDWNTAWSSEKLDGSLIKVVKLGNGLLVSTNGTIDAYKAPVQESMSFSGKSFGDLFEIGVASAHREYDRISLERHYARADWHLTPMQWLWSILQEGFTYMFELTSPFCKVVVDWKETDIHFIGCRNNRTLEETRFFEHPLARFIRTPELFPLKTLKEVQDAASKLDESHEGFVVCDGAFRRNKVKSSLYCQLHIMANNHMMTFERGIDLIRENETDEVLAYFPEFKPELDRIRTDIDALVSKLDKAWELFRERLPSLPERREQAAFISSPECFGKMSGVGFSLIDGRVKSAKEWVWGCPTRNLAKYLGYKTEKTQNEA